ncbi:MAG TPA: protein-methionine-sulfoxide reductase catalytic subunit MsrP, partial [Planctomycetes bacterium]|nr:protein-methionine-sulfoxide reductase catalytic subunit MsrP [Planctomycetota bacterium]
PASPNSPFPPTRPGFPAPRNPRFSGEDLLLTPASVATTHNNFYEFSIDQERVHKLTGLFEIDPWTVEISGLLDKPGRYSVQDLEKLVPLEERIYRFRCVEAWSMVLPWTGIPLGKLCEKLGVHPGAKYLRLTSFHKPDQAPGFQKLAHYPWPYYESLRLDEARNELSLLATGLYGRPLPKQNGAPIRLVVPWKYGLKNIKSIVRIEFRSTRPGTFWNALQPEEFSWLSNVDPKVPHPRWSQATEKRIDTGEVHPTLPFNGYGEFVGKLYS